MKLEGKVAVVTGGGTGIGAATARALASEGSRVVVAGRRLEPLAGVARQIEVEGGMAVAFPADVTDEAQVLALVAHTMETLGQVDILVNSAGLSVWVKMAEMTAETWDSTLNVNLRSPFLAARAAWPHMVKQGGGLIVNVGSVASFEAYEGQTAYCASKFGLIGLTQVLALEGREHNIRAHAVCPGATRTPLWDAWAPPEVIARMMPPEEVAEAIRWLAIQPEQVTFGPLVIRNSKDPWAG